MQKTPIDRSQPLTMFYGPEIERTRHYGKPTLIVFGDVPLNDILEQVAEHKLEHVLIATVHDSNYQPFTINMPSLRALVEGLLARNICVTTEVRPDQLTDEFYKNMPTTDSRYAILVGIYIPEAQNRRDLVTLKVNSNFDSSNGGVWCASLGDVMDVSHFTPWTFYHACDTKIK